MHVSIPILVIGVLFVVVQGFFTYIDGYFTQAQMVAEGIMNGYSFMQHGGMWADVFVIPMLVSYIVKNYKLPYESITSLIILGISICVWVWAASQWSRLALQRPEAHTHDGRTTIAGWIHLCYGIA